MKIILKTKNLDSVVDFQTFVEKKLTSLKKYIDILKADTPEGKKTLAEVFVELEKENNHHRKGDIFWAKAKINLPGKKLMAQFRSDDIVKAVVGVRGELKIEIEKYKFKKIDNVRRAQRKVKALGI